MTYEIDRADDPERGIRVRCTDHDVTEEFEPGYRSGSFYCSECGFEVEVSLHDMLDWRDWGERC